MPVGTPVVSTALKSTVRLVIDTGLRDYQGSPIYRRESFSSIRTSLSDQLAKDFGLQMGTLLNTNERVSEIVRVDERKLGE